MEFSTKLDSSSRKIECPSCRKKRFVQYVDLATGEYLPDEYGRCDREQGCGYWKIPPNTPKEDRPVRCYQVPVTEIADHSDKSFKIRYTKDDRSSYSFMPKSAVYEISENEVYAADWFLTSDMNSKKVPYIHANVKHFGRDDRRPMLIEAKIETAEKEYYYIDDAAIRKSLNRNNCFVQFLESKFDRDVVTGLIERYNIGTSQKIWPGATIFYSIDKNNVPRRGKIMLFDPVTGKRKKQDDGKPLISSVHALLDKKDEKPPECFFGEHLLSLSDTPVAVVESEKTAIIASIYMPGLIWLACGRKRGLNADICRALVGRRVILFPDLGCFDFWSEVVTSLELENICSIRVSDTLEKRATEEERIDGLDIADYLLRQNPKDFDKTKSQQYPSTWDQPASYTPDELRYRFINWLTNLETAVITGNRKLSSSILEEIDKAGYTENVPDDLMNQYAPTVTKLINQNN